MILETHMFLLIFKQGVYLNLTVSKNNFMGREGGGRRKKKSIGQASLLPAKIIECITNTFVS